MELVKVSDLEARYGTVRSNVYTRMTKLGIRPTRRGRHSYLNAEQLQQMDELNRFIQDGGTISEFTQTLPPTVGAVGLECFHALEEACRQSWLLGTSQLAGLLGVSPSVIDEATGQFSDAGFVFKTQGNRLSGETAWSVEKPCSISL